MRELTGNRRGYLLFGAMTTPLAILCAGCPALPAIPLILFAALAETLLSRALGERGLAEVIPAPLAVLAALGLIPLEAFAASLCADCWPSAGQEILFPLTLLILAAGGTLAGTDGAGRVSVLLTRLLAAWFLLVLPAVAYETSPQPPVGTLRDALPVLPVCAIGFCGLFLPVKGREKAGVRHACFLFIAVLTLYACAGITEGTALLTAVKGMDRLHVRFESLASCAMTVGLYQTLTLIGCAASEILSALGAKKEWVCVFFLTAAGLIPVIRGASAVLLLTAAGLSWGLPVLAALPVVVNKRDRKSF